MPYLQRHKGTWRVRKPVPRSAQKALGKSYLFRGLGTADKSKANRLAIPVIAEFEEMIRLAEKGEWPPVSHDWIEETAHQWWAWAHENSLPGFFMDDPRGSGFENEQALEPSLKNFIAAKKLRVAVPSNTYERLRDAAIFEHHCEVLG